MNIKILVVDDEADVEHLLQQRFRRKIAAGAYQLTFANSGRNALSVIQAEPDFDVLLLDINMPEMDGLTLLAEAGPLLQHGRAVIVSAYSNMENIRLAMNRGAFDFVSKPINFDDLEATIEKTVRHVRELRQLKKEKELKELKIRFFDNIAHEFRTPLTLILSPIERLLQTVMHDAASRTELLAVDRNARYLLRLINQLLESARFEAGFLQLHEQPGDLPAFVHQVVQAFQPYAQQQQVTLELRAPVTGAWMYDEEKLGQVLYNLISNAIKFTGRQPANEKSIRGEVTISLQSGTTMQFVIADTGPGIPGTYLPYIFERFYQVFPQGERKIPGTGIGLSLVREYITLMQGTIQVNSKTGRETGSHGTTFIIELPLQPAVTKTTGTGQTASFWNWFPRQEDQMPVQLPSPADNTSLIVLVEDNEELANYIADRLTPLYRILIAGTAEKGWQLIQEELPDVVISDIMLPGMDGYALTSRIKTTPATDHIAVILLTAKATYDSKLWGLQQGADDYMPKPLQLEELLLRLHNLLTRQQRVRNFYGQQLAQPGLPHPMEMLQDGWLKELYKVLETHLDNPSLGVEWLAAKMGMSRKTLLRKVQMLTKLSPNELIRQYRLRKAADLLRLGHSVAQTAYAVGFETPTYFGQCFKELFGTTPGRFVDSEGGNK